MISKKKGNNMTLRNWVNKFQNIPLTTSWYIADICQSIGKQELLKKQFPQKLKALKKHSIIESAVSSNRIEGIVIEPGRIKDIMHNKKIFNDRDEEEISGYKDALNWIHSDSKDIELSENTILKLHKITRGNIWDAGKYKDKNIDIIEKYSNGRERIRFKTVSAKQTPLALRKMLNIYQEALKNKSIHPLLLLAILNLDFLCIHPFRDGNGRVSRLLLLLTCYHAGLEVGKYISLERLIEQNKERYYETLEESSQNWHKGKNEPWSYINYILYILKIAYQEFESRLNTLTAPKGSKTEIVLQSINNQVKVFQISDIERNCPAVSRELIRKILSNLKKENKVICNGKGPVARWKNIGKGNTSK